MLDMARNLSVITRLCLGSWVKQMEIFFSIVDKRVRTHGSFTSMDNLATRILADSERCNTVDGHPFNWTFRGYPMQDQEAV